MTSNIALNNGLDTADNSKDQRKKCEMEKKRKTEQFSAANVTKYALVLQNFDFKFFPKKSSKLNKKHELWG